MRPISECVVSPGRPELLAHVSCIRLRDVLILQGSPLLGAAFALGDPTAESVLRGCTLTLASTLLVAHIFSFNDWADAALDSSDPNKAAHVFAARGVGRRGVIGLSAGLLAASMLLFALLPRSTLLLAMAIAGLGGLYSHPSFGAKGTPVVSSLLHLVGGGLHFLLGYSVFAAIDQRGILIALFFALTFTAGHLNQETRDHEGDRASGTRTNAVAFGEHATFGAGLVLFTLAYADLSFLASRRIVPAALGLLPILLYPLHVFWSVAALRAGLSFASVSRFQSRYRLLYALIGAAMVAMLLLR